MENYEFNEKQNELFRLLQSRMRFVSVVFIFVGMLSGLFLLLIKIEMLSFSTKYNIIGTIFSVFLVVTGILLWKAAGAFLNIVKTQGSDIDILMDALKDLYRAFDIQMYMIIIAIFFIVMSAIFLRDFFMF
ncbi:MAG: hypothetical protein K2Q22_03285 [Cytophagales bacterium]|nr:hypothetical protein [Cytophagales bacterium]